MNLSFFILLNIFLKIILANEVPQKKKMRNMGISIETNEKLKNQTMWHIYKIEDNKFSNWTREEIKNLFKSKLDNNKPIYHPGFEMIDHKDEELPEEFDFRKQWQNCVKKVRNQGKCGSCWAFATAGVFTDRICISTNSSVQSIISPQNLISCDTVENGCHGGKQATAWEYLEKIGAVSEECMSYNSTYDFVPSCTKDTCFDNKIEFKVYKAQINKSKPLKCPHDIKKEIITNGPVTAGFLVAEDFMHYKGGIYVFDHGELFGGHAVKIVGWGKDKQSGVEYWIVENSWGPDWGEDGYFRVKVGEMLIDSNAYAGYFNQDTTMKSKFLEYLQ